ncbi:MAG TPA: hypothetical protein VMS64_03725 [Candidatus Methylomirabilis sp.]|nr:hypothetical protein [Candidatus Methylomirabilis sp.]
MATKAAVPSGKDAFAAVGEAIAAAADAMKKSTSDARHAAAEAMPVLNSALAKTAYTTSYYAAFGVVFAAVTLSRLVPPDNALAHGIRDGATAARDIVGGRPRRPTKASRAAQPAASRRSGSRRRTRVARRPVKRVVDGGSPS